MLHAVGKYSSIFVSVGVILAICRAAIADEVVRRPLETGLFALGRDGTTFGLEVAGAQGGASKRVLGKYLAVESEWIAYRGRANAFVPLGRLKADFQRRVLLAVFEHDAVNADGWYHHTVFEAETLWSVCALITGNGVNSAQVLGNPFNDSLPATLPRGTTVLIPAKLLDAVMRQLTPDRTPAPSLFRAPQPDVASLGGELRFNKDAQGRYAAYTLKRGESLYTSVVARFTDYHDNAEILKACQLVATRSRIKNVRDIDAGSEIRIPLDILSARYQPKGTPDREEYDKVIKEAARLKGNQGRAQGLAGITVILDPGHGGQDPGAKYAPDGLYEDELNYDIVCRIKGLLERETRARVFVTLIDRSSQYTPTDATRFENDTDEELLTNPRHRNADGATVSANLRWMLVNSIYQSEVKRGVDPNKIVFTSIHTDMLYNEKLRGAMIYIPGAQYRRQEEVRHDAIYAVYQEGKSYNHFTSNTGERRRDEAISRNFADAILTELGHRRIKFHDQGDPIRTVVRKARDQVYVPAVIRNTKVPTKVLIETANLNNATDRGRLADPAWREQFAEAYVDALKRYYGSDVKTRVAQVGGR